MSKGRSLVFSPRKDTPSSTSPENQDPATVQSNGSNGYCSSCSVLFSLVACLILVFAICFQFVWFRDRLEGQHLRFKQGLDPSTFDYVIVGSGSAGSVLANRLSADGQSTVLMLEAGRSDNTPLVQFGPAYVFMLKSSYDWQYYTVDGESTINPCHQVRKMFWPRAKVLGGCSSMNAMIYMRGSAVDYDTWNECELGGGSNIWSFNSLLKYFKKSERQLGDSQKYDEKYHGRDGEWIVTEKVDQFSVSKPIREAVSEALHIPQVYDLNNPELTNSSTSKEQVQYGAVGDTQAHIKGGKRFSTVDAFLNETILQRPNLFVRTEATVTRILFEGKRAVGVRYYDNRLGRFVEKMAKKEVILAGGAINSPQLLMLSGIGDAQELEKYNIPVVVNNPNVGKHLQDHLAVHIPYFISWSYDSVTSLALNPSEIYKALVEGRGKLSSNGIELNALLKTRVCEHSNNKEDNQATWDLPNQKCYSKRHCDAHDLQLHGIPTVVDGSENFMFHKHGYTFAPLLLQPKSRGRISLVSNDPFKAPLIDSNFLGDKRDQETVAEAVRLCLLVGEQLIKKGVFTKPTQYVQELIEKLHNATSESEKFQHLIDYSMKHVDLIYHPVGTCRMSSDASTGVVDEQLRVFGAENLRVVDGSVMPSIVRGNTQAPIVLIAEVASDLILKRL